MTKSALGCVVIGLLVGLLPASSWGGRKSISRPTADWEPIAQSDWDVSDYSGVGGPGAVMLFDKVYVDDSGLKTGKSYRLVYQRIKVMSERGRQWGDVRAPLLHPAQKIDRVMGRTVTRSGDTISLTADMMHEEVLLKYEGQEVKGLSFSLPGLTDDCIVEYMYTYTAPEASGEVVIQKEIPLLRGEYHWVPGELKMGRKDYAVARWLGILDKLNTANYVWLNPHGERDTRRASSEDDRGELVFSTSHVPAFKSEPYGMPDNSLKERLVLYYGSDDESMQYWANQSFEA